MNTLTKYSPGLIILQLYDLAWTIHTPTYSRIKRARPSGHLTWSLTWVQCELKVYVQPCNPLEVFHEPLIHGYKMNRACTSRKPPSRPASFSYKCLILSIWRFRWSLVSLCDPIILVSVQKHFYNHLAILSNSLIHVWWLIYAMSYFCVFASKCENAKSRGTLSSLRVFTFSNFRGKKAKIQQEG
jgi:hypothetical protein